MNLADKLAHMGVTPMPWRRRPEVLLYPQVPKPLHGVAPRVIFGQLWWDRTREAAYVSSGFHCVACGVSKFQAEEHQWLEGHEIYDINYPRGRMVYLETVALCHYCHNFVHLGRLQVLVTKGEASQQKFDAVVDHGFRVLQQAGLTNKEYRGSVAPWEAWRLVIDGVEYPPKYKTVEEWNKEFM